MPIGKLVLRRRASRRGPAASAQHFAQSGDSTFCRPDRNLASPARRMPKVEQKAACVPSSLLTFVTLNGGGEVCGRHRLEASAAGRARPGARSVRCRDCRRACLDRMRLELQCTPTRRAGALRLSGQRTAGAPWSSRRGASNGSSVCHCVSSPTSPPASPSLPHHEWSGHSKIEHKQHPTRDPTGNSQRILDLHTDKCHSTDTPRPCKLCS